MTEDDTLDGCDIDFSDEATVSSDEQAVAILLFGDLQWVGEAGGVPVCDESEVAKRIADLHELGGNDA